MRDGSPSVLQVLRALPMLPVLLVTLLLAACGGAAGPEEGALVEGGPEDTDGMHGAVLTEPYSFPDARLTDTDGEAFGLHERLDEPLTLVFFGYTHCPDICQAVMADLASAQARLEESQAQDVQVWFVTTDPARDDPETLRGYLDRFSPEFEGLTGSLRTIATVARGVHVPIEKGPRLATGGYEVTHGTPVLAVQPDGTVPVLWTEGTSAAKIAEDVSALLAGDAGQES